ncbi:hypothetical protein L1049_002297 [Liquidambar formosana]|uniref:Uncharacterized protein n=1 Tax=Liquidambar formosana TaxID=63359 RepID=A0AAP0NGU1_LIQFO
MATEAESEIAESLSLTKREGEDKDLISRQLDTTVDEYCCPGELKKVEGGHNESPETVEDSANRDTMQAAIPIGDETVSTIIEGNVETLEGKSFLESPSVANIASEETCRVSEHHWADEKPNQTEKEISENEIQLQKDQKFEDLEETGCEKNKAVEETKERAEKGNDSIDIVSVIETGLEKTKTGEPALKVEEEETLMKQLILDQNVEIVAKRQASIEREPLSIEEAIRPPLTLLKDMTPIKDEIQDKNNLDTPFVIQTEEMCLQKEEKPEIFKEVSEIGSEGVVKESPKEVEDQTKIPQKTAQADSTTPEKGKDDESPEQKVDDSFIQREESKQIKVKKGWLCQRLQQWKTETEDKFTVVVTEGNTSNTEIAGAEEHMIKETSKYEEDPEQSFLQHNEPKKEKLERSSNVISESENAETITCLKEERSINNLEESFEEKGREDKPTDTDDISEHVIPTEKNFPPIDLNEKIDSAEVEIPEKNVNALHVTHSLVEETEQVERENVDAVSKFEPQEEVNEANGASTDEEKQIEKASEPCKITESTTSEHTSKEVAATKELISSKIDAEKLQKINGLDSEEKIEVGDAGENIEEETQKNEEAFAADMHKITSDDTQEGIIEEDAPVKDCSNVGSADETVEQSFQVESLDDAAPELINNSNKVEDDVERNSTIDEEVHDIPKTTGEGEITKEYDIEGNVGQSKRIKDEKDEERQIPHDGIRDVSISTVTENPDMQNDEEAILEIGEGAKDKLDTPPLTLPKDITPIEYESSR